MDVKELVKFKFISQMGNDSALNWQQLVLQMFMFVLMSFMDDIAKAAPLMLVALRGRIKTFCTNKVQETIVKRIGNQLIDSCVSLSTRHDVSVFSMSRIFSSSDSKSHEASAESNGIIDAFIAHVSKLHNIPMLQLIQNGQIMLNYMDKPIQITRDIFLKVDSIDTTCDTISSITLSIMSNTLSSAELVAYAKNIYANHLEEIKNSLGNKIYYFDQKSKNSVPQHTNPGQTEENMKQMMLMLAPKELSFTMSPFYSNKSFSNIYGDEVRMIEKRLRFFIDRRDWYDDKGIPYQLGIMLSGMPGAGKTSIIRAIANLTRRHIVNVNFSNIQTATQLKNLFYSDKLQVFKDSSISDVQSYFIPTDQRIYVLEEVDAIGDIVKQRTNVVNNSKKSLNDELTLMEILTVLDGTMEIPGRIIIMTSNHPDVLDKALIRPGRIDVQVQFGYAKRELIAELFEAYFDEPFPSSEIHRLPDKELSPAEVGQVLFKHFGNVDREKVVADLVETAGRNQKRVHVPDDEKCLVQLHDLAPHTMNARPLDTQKQMTATRNQNRVHVPKDDSDDNSCLVPLLEPAPHIDPMMNAQKQMQLVPNTVDVAQHIKLLRILNNHETSDQNEKEMKKNQEDTFIEYITHHRTEHVMNSPMFKTDWHINASNVEDNNFTFIPTGKV